MGYIVPLNACICYYYPMKSAKETRIPADLNKALKTISKAEKTWKDITPLMRRDWILWIVTAKKPETRVRRIEKAIDMLSHGKRRVCCFGGAKWLVRIMEEKK